MIYMNTVEKYPLQTYLQTIVINPEAFFRNATNISAELGNFLNLVRCAHNERGAALPCDDSDPLRLSVPAEILYDGPCHGQRQGLMRPCLISF